jgi:hypothetical protein
VYYGVLKLPGLSIEKSIDSGHSHLKQQKKVVPITSNKSSLEHLTNPIESDKKAPLLETVPLG